MTRGELYEQIKAKGSFLCIGLDSDIAKIPSHLQGHPDAIFEFNKAEYLIQERHYSTNPIKNYLFKIIRFI